MELEIANEEMQILYDSNANHTAEHIWIQPCKTYLDTAL